MIHLTFELANECIRIIVAHDFLPDHCYLSPIAFHREEPNSENTFCNFQIKQQQDFNFLHFNN